MLKENTRNIKGKSKETDHDSLYNKYTNAGSSFIRISSSATIFLASFLLQWKSDKNDPLKTEETDPLKMVQIDPLQCKH